MFERVHPGAVTNTYMDACAGLFFDSGYPDYAAVSSDGSLWIHRMPRYSGGIRQMNSTFTGVTSIARRQLDQVQFGSYWRQRDELVVAHSGGISTLSFTGTQPTASTVAGSSSASARQVRVGDLGGGRGDIVCLNSTGTKVTVFYVAGGSATWSAPAGVECYAVETLDIGGGPRRIFVAASDGLYQLASNVSGPASRVESTSEDATAGFLAVVRLNSGDAEEIAWAFKSNGDDIVRLYPRAIGSGQGDLDMEDIDIVGLAAGDFDGNGDDELVISQQYRQCFAVLLNQENFGNHYFSTGLFEGAWVRLQDPNGTENGWSESTAYGGNELQPVVTDIDGDGDSDLLAIVEGVASAGGGTQDEIVWIESPFKDADLQMLVPLEGGESNLFPGVTLLEAQVEADTTYANGTNTPYTHSQVITWDLAWNATTGTHERGDVAEADDEVQMPAESDEVLMDLSASTPQAPFFDYGGQVLLFRAIRVEWDTATQRSVITRCGPAMYGYLVNYHDADDVQGEYPDHAHAFIGIEGHHDTEITHKVGWVHLEPPPPEEEEEEGGGGGGGG
ncbi:MAG: hypothetical protein AB7O84_08490 [Planctomycetota bacterium]